ncbi:hypothetical protein Efla_002457 [Eimeria flavescens]
MQRLCAWACCLLVSCSAAAAAAGHLSGAPGQKLRGATPPFSVSAYLDKFDESFQHELEELGTEAPANEEEKNESQARRRQRSKRHEWMHADGDSMRGAPEGEEGGGPSAFRGEEAPTADTRGAPPCRTRRRTGDLSDNVSEPEEEDFMARGQMGEEEEEEAGKALGPDEEGEGEETEGSQWLTEESQWLQQHEQLQDTQPHAFSAQRQPQQQLPQRYMPVVSGEADDGTECQEGDSLLRFASFAAAAATAAAAAAAPSTFPQSCEAACMRGKAPKSADAVAQQRQLRCLPLL